MIDWKDIKDYEGLYKIGSNGEVLSCKRKVLDKNGQHLYSKDEKILKPYITKHGYYRLLLCKQGVVKRFPIHRLVGLNLISNPNNFPCINHKDGNKLNNNVDNLEWCTYAHNINHAIENGLKLPTILDRDLYIATKIKKKDCEIIKTKFKNGYSKSFLSKEYNVSYATIHRIIYGRNKMIDNERK